MLHTFLDESSFVFSCTTLKQSWTLLIKIDITIHFQPFFFRKSEQENTNCLYIIHTFLDESSFVFSQQSIIIIADSSELDSVARSILLVLYCMSDALRRQASATTRNNKSQEIYFRLRQSWQGSL